MPQTSMALLAALSQTSYEITGHLSQKSIMGNLG